VSFKCLVEKRGGTKKTEGKTTGFLEESSQKEAQRPKRGKSPDEGKESRKKLEGVNALGRKRGGGQKMATKR